MYLMHCLLFLFVVIIRCSAFFGDDDYEDEGVAVTSSSKTFNSVETCIPTPLGGIQWIISTRHPDYGWKDETHRAVIALAINDWGESTSEEIRQMELQLEVEITRALLRNATSRVYPNDLALYIHALIATKRNPRNFYGIDLVENLLHIAKPYYRVHPFLLLALCNSNAIPENELRFAASSLHSILSSTPDIEYMALTLKAYECVKTLNYQVDDNLIVQVRQNLANLQNQQGNFGNVYRTSLVVQALASASEYLDWNESGALEYLRNQSTIDVNMVSTYLIELALNAKKVKFIKDLHPEVLFGPAIAHPNGKNHFVQYTIKCEKHPTVYFTISIKVQPSTNFYDIMKLSAAHDSKFNFSDYRNKDGFPSVYSISGIPNDAEENLFWRLCLQYGVNHDPHDSKIRTVHESPEELVPKANEHVIYWYRDTECETSM